MNPSTGGIWRTIDGTTTFTARIGDIIGMRTSVESSVGPIGGAIPSWTMVASSYWHWVSLRICRLTSSCRFL